MAEDDITIEATREYECYEVAKHMRREDMIEIYYMSNQTPLDCLLWGWKSSPLCWTVKFHYHPIAILGVAHDHKEERVGRPWLLCTEDIRNVREDLPAAMRLARIGQSCLLKMLSICPILENWVFGQNLDGLRLVKQLGFHVEEAMPFGVEGQPFHRFWKTGGQ